MSEQSAVEQLLALEQAREARRKRRTVVLWWCVAVVVVVAIGAGVWWQHEQKVRQEREQANELYCDLLGAAHC